MRAWLMLAKDGGKRIGAGYDDNPATHYRPRHGGHGAAAGRRLHLADDLKPFPDYAKLHCAPLAVSVTGDHVKWLAKHWAMHRTNTVQATIPQQSGPADTAPVS